ncbi:MAG: thiol reductant ABC exporter subunit CydD [Coriobacteriia bacterium]|nr:thiol reductant ABC exporter subunit CydD [Coriobacteriia bacterium]
MLALLLVFGACDALLIVLQAFCLSAAVVVLWNFARGGEAFTVLLLGVPLTTTRAGMWLGVALYAAGFLLAYVARQLLQFAKAKVMDAYGTRQAASLRAQLMQATYDQGQGGVQRRGTGAATSLALEGISAVKTYIGTLFPKVAELMAVPAVLTVALFAFDWVSGLIALVILPCIIGYMRLLGAQAKQLAAAQLGAYNRLSNHFMDTLRGMPTLKAFGRSGPYVKQVYAVSERLREATVKTLRTATLSSLVLDLFRTGGLAAVAIMLGFRLLDGSMTLFPALAVLIMVPEYFAAVRRYANDFHATLDGRTNLAAVLDVLRAGEGGGGVARAAGAHAVAGAGQPWGETSTLALEGVSFAYGEDAPNALQDVSLQLQGCCKVGVVGVSGSGKSTLVQLLAGFSAPSAGRVLVDGTEVALASPAWLQQVTYIPQTPHLFSATLRENIAFYAPDASEDALQQAVDLAGLRALVEVLPQGLDTPIGEGGRQLSGGQAQRVALARAFLDANRKVLVFDEPTAHLDIETELALKQNMLPLMEGRLVLFATHRLHWVNNMDVVVVLEDGRVAEVGTPAELGARAGAFSRLVDALREGGAA